METLLKNEAEFIRFARAVLQKPETDEVLVAFLAARRKYSPEIPRNLEVVAREILKDVNRDYLLQKIRKLATVGFYSDMGKVLPTSCFALYIDVNPKSTMKAAALFGREAMDQMRTLAVSETKAYGFFRNIDARLFSAMQRSGSKNHPYWCVDIDIKEPSTVSAASDHIGAENIVWTSETHGGYHLLVRKNGETGRKLFAEPLPPHLADKIEVKKTAATPIPGTLQGGHLVRRFRMVNKK
jgi:hypothetical protein